MERQVTSPARRRSIDRVLFIVVPLIFLNGLLELLGFHYYHLHPAGVLAVVCAALQSLPMIALIVIEGLYLSEEKDDFQRAVDVQSFLWATGVTLAVTTFMGGMEKYSLVAHMDVAEVQFVFLFAMCISLAVNAWRYR